MNKECFELNRITDPGKIFKMRHQEKRLSNSKNKIKAIV